jgi:glycosyltransferase involved in cell wall biosynthesis
MSGSSLNVLIVGPYPRDPDKVVGGVEAVNATLTPALAAQDEIGRVTVLSFHRSVRRAERQRIDEKLQVWHLPGQRRPLLTRALPELWQARRAVAQIQPDIVHGHGIAVPGDIATQLGRPSVVTVHGMEHVEAQMSQSRSLGGRVRVQIVQSTVKRVLRRAQVVISISDYDAHALDGLVHGQRVSIPNPVLPTFFAEPRFDSDGQRLLFAGVLSPRKNVEGLLRAFAIARNAVPAATLTIMGPTPNQGYLEQVRGLVSELGLDAAVTFLGHVETARLVEEMRACRAVALFSHEETSPTVLAQALALGKPVVATRVGGIPEMVSDGENGFLIERGDEQALAARLAQLLNDPALGSRMGQRGHQIALQRCEPQAVAQQTIRAYRLAQQLSAQRTRRGREPQTIDDAAS